jgi:signal transduction histidine kinase
MGNPTPVCRPACARQSNLAELAGDMTHQINNVMTSLMVCAEALCRAPDRVEQAEMAGNIVEGLRRCRTLSHGFLRAARRPWRGEVERVQLCSLLAPIDPLLHHRFKRSGVRLELALDPLPPALVRAAEAELLLLELLRAALAGASPGQSVRIEGESGPGDRLHVSVWRSAEVEPAQEAVPGPPVREVDLELCRELALELGGELHVEAAPAEGCAWQARLQLPLGEDA